jgi:acetyl esterase/lipase
MIQRVLIRRVLLPLVLVVAGVCLASFSPALHAEESQTTAPKVVRLWPDGAPGSVGNTEADRPSITDRVVPPENSVSFYLALRKAGVSAEMHIYEKGPHGFGLAPQDPVLSSWPVRCEAWLRAKGWLPGKQDS